MAAWVADDKKNEAAGRGRLPDQRPATFLPQDTGKSIDLPLPHILHFGEGKLLKGLKSILPVLVQLYLIY